jgi:hypothetical protein
VAVLEGGSAEGGIAGMRQCWMIMIITILLLC